LKSGVKIAPVLPAGQRVVAVDNGCRSRECTLLLDETGNLNEPR